MDRTSSEAVAHHATVFEAIDRSHSLGGSQFLRALVDAPTDDADVLRARQRVLVRARQRLCKEDQPLALSGREAEAQTRAYERDVVWAFLDRDDATAGALYDVAFFQAWYARALNGSPAALTAMNVYRIAVSPLLGLLSPVLYFVVPYLIMRHNAAHIRRASAALGLPFSVPSSFAAYVKDALRSVLGSEELSADGVGGLMGGGLGLQTPAALRWVRTASYAMSLLLYFQSLFNSFEISRTLRVVSSALNARMTHVWRFLARAATVVEAFWDDGIRDAWFEGVESADELLDVTRDFAPEHEAESFHFGAAGGGWHVGAGLAAYKTFDHARCRRLLRTYYAVDAVLSVGRLLNEGRVSLLHFVQDSGCPALDLRNVWHPCLAARAAVRNDLVIDRAAGHANVMLTGPNAGGKSTLIKSVVISALLAQSLTVAPCAPGSRITPFVYINSQINVPDAKGERSLFEEEMFRARCNLEEVRRAAGRPTLVVVDEIFSSTNPVEGICAAFAVAKHLASAPNCACLISTHYTYLCGLARAVHVPRDSPIQRTPAPRLFHNYQMPVREREHESDAFEYPYVLRRGVCRQYIALELLRKNGFADGVLDDALEVKRIILQPHRSVDASRNAERKASQQADDPSP